MKSFFKLTLLVFMVVMASCLVACDFYSLMLNNMDEDERADRIIMMADLNIAKQEQYQMVSVSTMTTDVMGEKITETDRATVTYIENDTDELIYQEKIESTVKTRAGEDNRIEITGYQDGYMYKYVKTEDKTIRFKSAILAEEYMEHMMNVQNDLQGDVSKNTCDKITAVQNDDGSWIVTYSQFKSDGLAKFLDDMGNPQLYFEDYEVVDVNIEFEVSSKFVLEKSRMNFVFEKSNSSNNNNSGIVPLSTVANYIPVCKIEYSYSYGDDVTISENVDLENNLFTTVEDLRIYDIVDKQLTEIKGSENATATVNFEFSTSYPGYSNEFSGDENIFFKTKDGKLDYEINSNSNEGYYKLIYSDGKQELFDEKGNLKESEDISELEAKIILDTYIDPAKLSIENIVGMREKSEGTYVFNLMVTGSEIQDMAASIGGKLSRTQLTVTIKMEEGKISSYVYTVDTTIKITGQNIEVEYDQEYECTYNY